MQRHLAPAHSHDPAGSPTSPGLPPIPVVETGRSYALDLIDRAPERLTGLLEEGAGHIPKPALAAGDLVSRRWLARHGAPQLAEIDAVARRIGRPGAHFFNVHYEWGCTTAAKPAPDGEGARLVRVLDWKTKGLGRHIVAARIPGPAGPWISLTWPGFTGALQAMAPGRFSAAINQAPMRTPIGAFYADWAVNRARVWRQPHLTPAHLLRQVMEEAPDFATARRRLIDTPISAPAIFTLAGIDRSQACVIERQETAARVRDGSKARGACAANDWPEDGLYRGRPRGCENPGRRAAMERVPGELRADLAWLVPPMLNVDTRLALVCDAREGRLVAQGFDGTLPVTAILNLAA